MTRDDPAKLLGRWLDARPGTAPPQELEPDVVEAIYALRTDLAPAPRLTADDILATITAGPFATETEAASDPGSEEIDGLHGAVVPFPAPEGSRTSEPDDVAAEAPPPRRGRFGLSVGGTSGLGLTLVAAATLMLVAYPTLQDEAGAPSPASFDRADLPAAPKAEATAGEVVPPVEVEISPASQPRASREAPVQSWDAEANGQAEQEVYEMEDAVAAGPRDLIPELSVAAATPAQEGEEIAAEPASDEAEPGVVGRPSVSPPTEAWRMGIAAETLVDVDAVLTTAQAQRDAGQRAASARTLAEAVRAPAAVAQYLALLSAMDSLAVGDPQSAADVAERGLSFSGPITDLRRALLVAQGDALLALGRPDDAQAAYQQAR